MKKTRDVRGACVPSFMYGTAWKEDNTANLVRMALEAGFRAIDTANQRRHYHEAGVGEALAEALGAGLSRDDIFVQTKFTYVNGQDHRLPYDPQAPFSTQVQQSFASSLEHLGLERLDSYVLHGPMYRAGLAPEDLEVWQTMEALLAQGKTRLLGVSNVSAEQLTALCSQAQVKPAFVQNRCFAQTGWDQQVRTVCEEHDIVYQGFSLLTANRLELAQPDVQTIAANYDRTVAQVVFRFAMHLGMLPLTGTTNREHALSDLQAFDFELTDDEVQRIERIAL